MTSADAHGRDALESVTCARCLFVDLQGLCTSTGCFRSSASVPPRPPPSSPPLASLKRSVPARIRSTRAAVLVLQRIRSGLLLGGSWLLRWSRDRPLPPRLVRLCVRHPAVCRTPFHVPPRRPGLWTPSGMKPKRPSCASSDFQSSSDEGSSSPDADAPSFRAGSISFTFLGTGGSSALPLISCVTEPDKACPSCFDTLWDPASKNIRGNTGGVIRVPRTDGTEA